MYVFTDLQVPKTFPNVRNDITFTMYEQRRYSILKTTCSIIACQLTFTCSKSTIETLEKGVKYVQS